MIRPEAAKLVFMVALNVRRGPGQRLNLAERS